MSDSAIFTKYAAQAAANPGRAPSMPDADVAAAIRAQLRARFPDVKFSVRASRGSAVNVSYIDGPQVAEVEAICDPFSGRGFDGMIDMGYYMDVWLCPDGSAAPGVSQGTEGSMGMHSAYSNPPPDPRAVLVSPSCFIFVSREMSVAAWRAVLERYASMFDDAVSEAIRSGRCVVEEGIRGGGYPLFLDSEPRAESGEWGGIALGRMARGGGY